MSICSNFYTKYKPNTNVEASQQLEVHTFSKKRSERFTYKPFLVNTKLLSVTSQFVILDVKSPSGNSEIKIERIYTVTDINTQTPYGEVNKQNLNTLIKNLYENTLQKQSLIPINN